VKFSVVHLDLDSLSCPAFSSLVHEMGITQQVSISRVKGLAITVVDIPCINCPLLAICHFPMQNQKMVVGSTNQLPTMFGRIIEFNRLSLRRRCWPLALHVKIGLY
jgi:hypothetical protein